MLKNFKGSYQGLLDSQDKYAQNLVLNTSIIDNVISDNKNKGTKNERIKRKIYKRKNIYR